MRKNSLLLCLLLGLALNSIQGQIFKGQVIGGLNVAQIDGDEVYGYKKWGSNIGLGVIFPINKKKKLMISLETIYNQKGSVQRKTAVDTFPENWKYRAFLDYLEAPVMIHIEDKETVTFGLGFSWGRLVGIREYENGKLVENTTLTSRVFNRNDWNFLADIRFRLWRQLKFNFRYAYSIVPIRERDFIKNGVQTRKQYNNMLTMRLIYIINEKKEARKSKPKQVSAEE